jgi:hypothetical protein
MAVQCEMVVGFLVPRRCDRKALGQCSQCSRRYCEEHMDVRPGGLLCVACEQGLDRPVALPGTAMDYTADELAAFTLASTWDETDSDLFSDLS